MYYYSTKKKEQIYDKRLFGEHKKPEEDSKS